jgi:hypothetical protein
LLLVAAGLKLSGVNASAAPAVGWFAEPQAHLLVAEWELILGAWLLSGIGVRASWIAALMTFVVFAGVSSYLGLVGATSCGCLGAVKVNPWWTFGVDVLAVVVLAASRPKADAVESPRFLRTACLWVSSVALASAVLVAAGGLVFGSVEMAVAKLRGDTIAITPSIDLGSGKPGETLEATATVINYTSEPVRLIGGTTDCSCATIDDFPLTVPPGNKASFRVRLTVVPGKGGQTSRVATVRTDCPSRPVIQFRIGYHVEE